MADFEKPMEILIIIYPRCECGVGGDLLVQSETGKISHVWCRVCGAKLSAQQGLSYLYS